MKIFDILNRITTVAPDTSKHIVGAVYSLWILMVITAFFGVKAGFFCSVVVMVLFVLWEIYWMKKENKPFSVKDVMAGVIVVLPFIFLLSKLL